MTKDQPKTPRSDALEAQRKAFCARRTPAYGEALALCRKLESEVAELQAQLPKENRFYKLGGQLDDVVPGHVLLEARPTTWCHFEQKWIF